MFYDNLLKICEEQGTFPTRALRECGAATGSIGGWKNGAWPNSEIVVKLAAHLNVSTDCLLLGANSSSESNEQNKDISSEAHQLAKIWDELDQHGKTIVMAKAYERQEVMRSSAEDAAPDEGLMAKEA